jgi:hypothetical protein
VAPELAPDDAPPPENELLPVVEPVEPVDDDVEPADEDELEPVTC